MKATFGLVMLLAMSPMAFAICDNCGSVVDVKTIKKEGEASGGGAVLGGVLGGVLGHQVGSGRGNTAATVVGAGAGAYAGHQIEKNNNATTSYQVVV
jgi:outer membrane lipoprotein SlyB